jgi:polar amino acid transport system substrate-binding protein
VEIVRAFSEHAGRPIRIENYAFEGLIPALKTGKIDLIVSSMTVTEKRALSIDFSDSYLDTGICLLVQKDSSIQSIDDVLEGRKTVAVKNGTTGHIYAMDHLKSAEVLVLDTDAACVMEVAQGKADAFIYDQISIYQHWQKHLETTRAILKPIQKESWAIGIKKGNDALRATVNTFLADFRADGGFGRLSERFLKEQKAVFKELGHPFYF